MARKQLRMIISGDSDYEFYAKAFQEVCDQRNDVKSILFHYGLLSEENRNYNTFAKAEYHFKNGFIVCYLNRNLLSLCSEFKPHIVFLYNCTVIYPSTVREMREKGIYVAIYSNDDPFSDFYTSYVWRHFKKSLPLCSHAYVYREKSMADFQQNGAKNVSILKFYYLRSSNYYIPDEQITLHIPDVVF